MNLAVAFTEYQLLQVQALANHYKLENLNLVILDNDRIELWLINNELYEDILVLPAFDTPRWQRVFKSFIDKYNEIVSDFLDGRNTGIFIGAQDENTIYTLIKTLANPEYYWNIEDGFANYYSRSFSFQIGICLKKQLFKFVYGYKLPIAYGHGLVVADKSFRIVPEISTSQNEIIPMGNILKEYLVRKAMGVKDDLSFLKKYEQVKRLVITDIETFKSKNQKMSEVEVYKFHPKDRISNEIGVNYITEKIPIEILPFLLPSLEAIRFEVMSSSILNLCGMQTELDVEIAFTPNTEPIKKVINYITQNFAKKVELLRC